MNTVQQINEAIVKTNFTKSELASIIDAIRFAQRRFQMLNRMQFSVGDRVQFTDRYGCVVQGKITKINQKNIKLISDNLCPWVVSPSLLSKI